MAQINTIHGNIKVIGNLCCGQYGIGSSAEKTSAVDISQEDDFDGAYHSKYIITPTAAISLTMAPVDTIIKIGYQCSIHNAGSYDLTIKEGTTGSDVLIIRAGQTRKIIARSPGSGGGADVWTAMDENYPRIMKDGVAIGASDTLNFAGSGVGISHASGVATVTVAGGGSSRDSYYNCYTSEYTTTSSTYREGIAFTSSFTLNISKAYFCMVSYQSANSSFYSYTQIKVTINGSNVHEQYNPFVYQSATRD
ncbi:hypothetical protein KDA11_05380, partial [Candidatus Saccharibacteria bacterium]|nr:hypothetical protein [Candidatus Saccharibacteria bacterium]